MAEITTSREMKNVALSENSKGFLVAHRLVQEATDCVFDAMTAIWGENENERYIEDATNKLCEYMGAMQSEIISLMGDAIHENLSSRKVTEI